jgi:H2-forming N5,N10-methylenetetrahydromethanopterin dehydrogenase-like enzyme
MWQSEHNVIIGSWKEFVHSGTYPFISSDTSTVWAVPVSTAMIEMCGVSTFPTIAPTQMISFGCGMTCGKIGEYSPAVGVEGLDGRMSEQALERDLN